MMMTKMKLFRRAIKTDILDVVFYSRYPLTDNFAEDIMMEFIRNKESFVYEVQNKGSKAQYIVYI